MVTRILQARSSVKGVLDYSERKVESGDACVVAVRNMDGEDLNTIYGTFARYESNPAISERARSLAFHLAVNPGPEDNMSRESVQSYIGDYMRMLGFGGQPYVVYRHNDIEREHYHVVSVRVDQDGGYIRRCFEGRRSMKIQETLAAKYGFHVGLPKEAPEPMSLRPCRFDPKAGNKLEQLRVNLEDALECWSWEGMEQLQSVLRYRGMEMGCRDAGGQKMAVTGLGPDGAAATRGYDVNRLTGTDVAARMAAADGTKGKDEAAARRCAHALSASLAAAHCVEDVEDEMRRREAELFRIKDAEGRLANACVVDAESRCVFAVEELLRGARERLSNMPRRMEKSEKREMKEADRSVGTPAAARTRH